MSDDAGPEQPAAERNQEDQHYRVDVTHARGVLVGDGSTQHNYFQFFAGTWTDGVAPQPLVAASGQVDSPYRGLEAFREADADFFFGRDAAISEVLDRLSGCLAGAGLLVVSGVSGVGKTSLMRAGVLCELRRAGLPSGPEAAQWPCVVLVPGGSPLNELALAIAPATGADAAAVRQSLAANPADFALTARQAAQSGVSATSAADRRRVLLVVDQCETVFTQCDRDEERTAFFTALCAAGSAGAAVVVIVIRADLEARLADYPALADAVQGRYLLGGMTERQLRLAITEPAETVNSAVDDDLVADLLREVRAHADRPGGGSRLVGAGVLPLLSHALDQAWRGRPPSARAGNAPLALADYERTGGIDRAVADSAQAAYALLTAAQQAAAQQVFTRLVATTTDGIDTAVRATRAGLLAGQDGSAVADVEAVLSAFAAKRLLTLAADSVEISHEVLLSAWPLLRDDWLAATRADRADRARLQATVAEWLASGLDRSFLYSGTRLTAASQSASRIAADGRQTPPSREERAFLAASKRAAERAARIRRVAVAAIAVLAVGLAVALVVATTSANGYLRERDQATENGQQAAKERDTALAELADQTSGLLASESLPLQNTNPVIAAEHSVLAWALNPQSQEAQYALQSSAADPLTAVFQDPADSAPASVAFSPDGKTLAVTDRGGDVAKANLWNLVAPSGPPGQLAVGGTTNTFPDVTPEVFSQDGKSLIVADSREVARWNIAPRREEAAFSVVSLAGLTSLALSPDGRTLAVGGLICECVQLRNAATGEQIGTPLAPVGRAALADATGNVLVAFSRDGKTLITTGPDDIVRLWSMATHRQQGPAFPALASTIDSLAVSPDGTTLAVGEDDGTVRLWDVSTGREVGQTLIAGAGNGAPVETVAFSPDGSMIAAGDQNSTVRVWSVPTQRQVGPVLTAGVDIVNAVAFSPDSRELASADADGSVRLWNLTALSGSQAAPPVAVGEVMSATGVMEPAGLGAVALGPDGKLATSDNSATVAIWHAVGGSESGYPAATVLNPSPSNEGGPVNGRTLATGADDGSVRLWNLPVGLATDTPARTIPLPAPSTAPTVQFLAFSPNGRRLAVYYASGTVEVFDTATGQPVAGTQALENQTGNVVALGFTPSGTVRIAFSTGDVLALNLVAVPTPAFHVAAMSGPTDSLPAAALSPDGTTIAFATSTTFQLWDMATGQPIGDPIAPNDGTIFNLAFSPDGGTLATGGDDGTVRQWNVRYLTPVGALAELCARIQPAMSASAWTAASPAQAGTSYERACATRG
ncbi:MAG TPA: AAA family ATPase [Trebonia sp.]